MIVVNLSKYANNIFNIFFRKGTLLPELSDEIGYCPECPAGDVQWPAESKKDLEKYKRHVKTSKHTDYGIGKKVLWNCGMCETEYPLSRDFQKHLCQQKKSCRPMDAGLQPVRYTKKPITKKIYQEAKKWSLPVMYGVAFEEKWCLPGMLQK